MRSVFTLPLRIYTGKSKPDGAWERFAVVSAGTGAKLSNQRGFRSNDYIRQFSGRLTIEFDASLADQSRVRDFITYAGREVGIGASRKMGWGRFTVQ